MSLSVASCPLSVRMIDNKINEELDAECHRVSFHINTNLQSQLISRNLFFLMVLVSVRGLLHVCISVSIHTQQISTAKALIHSFIYILYCFYIH